MVFRLCSDEIRVGFRSLGIRRKPRRFRSEFTGTTGSDAPVSTWVATLHNLCSSNLFLVLATSSSFYIVSISIVFPLSTNIGRNYTY